MSDDDLNPSATGLTTKEVLLEVRADVKQIGRDVSILTSQDLDHRVNSLESWADRVNGRVNALIVVITIAGAILSIIIALRILFPANPAA